jgi:hypothetical protein
LPDQSDIASSLREWFETCPCLNKESQFVRVDYLGERAKQYAIYLVASEINSSMDIVGNVIIDDTVDQNFIFASKEIYGQEVLQNLQNLGFFDEIVRWMILQNGNKKFPKIKQGKVISVLPTTTPTLLYSESNTGRYQIQGKIRYIRKEE